MKAFLWTNVEEISDRYHSDGSILIEAETVNRAKGIAEYYESRYNPETKSYEDFPVQIKLDKEPDAIFDSSSVKEKVWIFPDAGCC